MQVTRKKVLIFLKKCNFGKKIPNSYMSFSFCSSSTLTRLMASQWYKYEGTTEESE